MIVKACWGRREYVLIVGVARAVFCCERRRPSGGGTQEGQIAERPLERGIGPGRRGGTDRFVMLCLPIVPSGEVCRVG